MNAYELCKPDGTPCGIFACGECGLVYGKYFKDAKQKAEECCDKRCKICDDKLDKISGYTVCDKCRISEEIRKEKERFEKAEKVLEKDWNGPVYTEELNHNDGYFLDLGELEDFISDMNDGCEECEDKGDYCKDECEGGVIVPEYVWVCNKLTMPKIDVYDVCESHVHDYLPEDWNYEDLEGYDELQAALDKFVADNQNVYLYDIDYKKAVILKKD